MNATRQAHRIETTLTEDGTLTLDHLPFSAGSGVEVIVLPQIAHHAASNRYPLRGMPYSYEGPIESVVSEEEWDLLQ